MSTLSVVAVATLTLVFGLWLGRVGREARIRRLQRHLRIARLKREQLEHVHLQTHAALRHQINRNNKAQAQIAAIQKRLRRITKADDDAALLRRYEREMRDLSRFYPHLEAS